MRLRELGQVSREARDLGVDLIYVYKHLLEGGKKTEPASSWWFPVTGQGAIGTNRNNFFKYIFTYFMVCGQALEEVAQNGRVVTPLRINSTKSTGDS